MKRLFQLVCAQLALVAVLTAVPAVAQQTGQTQVLETEQTNTDASAQAPLHIKLDAHDRLVAQIWGLNDKEMRRAKVLMEGPRKAFSVENLSPIEVLGIHARNDAERKKYAEKFARALHEDVQRSLAWNDAFAEAMQRMYPNEPVVSHAGLDPVLVPTGSADLAGVPRSLVIDPAQGSAPASIPVPANRQPIAVEPRK